MSLYKAKHTFWATHDAFWRARNPMNFLSKGDKNVFEDMLNKKKTIKQPICQNLPHTDVDSKSSYGSIEKRKSEWHEATK